MLSASHPHAYGALWQLQDRFDPELALHPGDLAWSGALRVSWPWDDRLEPLPGLELHLTAGHFDGHTVLFDRARGILFCGDALKFEMAARRSPPGTHHLGAQGVRARHPAHPARAAPIPRRVRAAALPQTWTPFEQARNSGRAEALALIDGMLATTPPCRPRAAGGAPGAPRGDRPRINRLSAG